MPYMQGIIVIVYWVMRCRKGVHVTAFTALQPCVMKLTPCIQLNLAVINSVLLRCVYNYNVMCMYMNVMCMKCYLSTLPEIGEGIKQKKNKQPPPKRLPITPPILINTIPTPLCCGKLFAHAFLNDPTLGISI